MIFALDRAALLNWFAGRPTQIALILATAFVVRLLLVRLLARVTRRTIELRIGRLNAGRSNEATAGHKSDDNIELRRRQQRATSVSQLLGRITSVTVWAIAAVTVLSSFGIDVAPILASAGVVGVALGFGAQTLVKDYLAGIFLIIEDQFGVGDVVDVGPVVGTVEDVTLRVTRLRDQAGVIWYVRNGEILRVANRTQGSSI